MATIRNTYTLYEQGPDNASTYAECWGSAAKSAGRNPFVGDAPAILGRLRELGHGNIVVRLHARRGVSARWLDRKGFLALARKRGEI